MIAAVSPLAQVFMCVSNKTFYMKNFENVNVVYLDRDCF